MVYNSLQFIFIYPFLFLFYHLIPGRFGKARNYFNIIVTFLVAGCDFLKSDNISQLKWIRNWYDRKGAEIFQDVDPSEKYKMMSYTYRYNYSH